jgi:hypothetical protein
MIDRQGWIFSNRFHNNHIPIIMAAVPSISLPLPGFLYRVVREMCNFRVNQIVLSESIA